MGIGRRRFAIAQERPSIAADASTAAKVEVVRVLHMIVHYDLTRCAIVKKKWPSLCIDEVGVAAVSRRDEAGAGWESKGCDAGKERDTPIGCGMCLCHMTKERHTTSIGGSVVRLHCRYMILGGRRAIVAEVVAGAERCCCCYRRGASSNSVSDRVFSSSTN